VKKRRTKTQRGGSIQHRRYWDLEGPVSGLVTGASKLNKDFGVKLPTGDSELPKLRCFVDCDSENINSTCEGLRKQTPS
jgi:hypothetical protein